MMSTRRAVQYPPPEPRTKRLTALECLIWLDELRAKYPTVEEAAKASHVSRNAIIDGFRFYAHTAFTFARTFGDSALARYRIVDSRFL